jgi:predicted outer membrane repeat protein
VTDTSDDVADTGSLRYALSQVNAGSGGDVINFSGVTGTITVGSTLAINESVTINGPGANLLTISGNDQVQVFNAAVGTTVIISGLTIAHGFLGAGDGAGIVSYGTNTSLTVNNCTFLNNVANGITGIINVGGAIEASNLTVNDSTFINNSAGGASNHVGGAIYVAVGTINNSTFVGNTAPAHGGAIYSVIGTNLKVHNSTIVGNTAGTDGGIGIGGATPVVTNSIISGNTGGDCARCSTTGTNLIGGTAALGPLQYNGGPTMTMAPLPSGTGIIGAGLNSTLATDQRGIPRPTSGASDLGAVQSYNLVVTTTDDSTNSSSTCDGSDTCSLRDALNLANTQGAGDVVTVGGLQGTINLTSSLPNDTADLNINGPGANQLTISGGGSYGIFNITNPAAVTKSNAFCNSLFSTARGSVADDCPSGSAIHKVRPPRSGSCSDLYGAVQQPSFDTDLLATRW